jgi:hypothetical protein
MTINTIGNRFLHSVDGSYYSKVEFDLKTNFYLEHENEHLYGLDQDHGTSTIHCYENSVFALGKSVYRIKNSLKSSETLNERNILLPPGKGLYDLMITSGAYSLIGISTPYDP